MPPYSNCRKFCKTRTKKSSLYTFNLCIGLASRDTVTYSRTATTCWCDVTAPLLRRSEQKKDFLKKLHFITKTIRGLSKRKESNLQLVQENNPEGYMGLELGKMRKTGNASRKLFSFLMFARAGVSCLRLGCNCTCRPLQLTMYGPGCKSSPFLFFRDTCFCLIVVFKFFIC